MVVAEADTLVGFDQMRHAASAALGEAKETGPEPVRRQAAHISGRAVVALKDSSQAPGLRNIHRPPAIMSLSPDHLAQILEVACTDFSRT